MTAETAWAAGPGTGPASGRPAGLLYRALFDTLPDAMAVLDRMGTIVAVNRAWDHWVQEPGDRRPYLGAGLNVSRSGASSADGTVTAAQPVLGAIRAVLGGQPTTAVIEQRSGDGAPLRWFRLQAMPLPAGLGGVVIAVRDITDERQREAQLARRALTDPLTGLPNRTLFRDRLAHALQRRQLAAGAVAVIVLDLDDFKAVNDTLGHAVGDALLQAVAARLVNGVRPSDLVARLGGDEFVVLLEDLDGSTAAQEVAARILTALRRPFRIGRYSLHVGASLGISENAPFARDGDAVLRQADGAMYQAKQDGKGRAVSAGAVAGHHV